MQSGVVAAHADDHPGRVAAPWHTVLVIAVQAALTMRGFIRSDQMRAMVNLDRIPLYQHTIVFEWLVFALVILGVRLHGTSLYAVLGERWRSAKQFFTDLGIGFLLLIFSIMIPSIFGPHQQPGATDRAVHFLLPQTVAEIGWWIVLALTAGICEETLFRGYLQRQFISLTKNVPAGILLSAVLFGAAHGYQGLWKAMLIGTSGAILGATAYWRKSVRPGMVAHFLQNLMGGLMKHA